MPDVQNGTGQIEQAGANVASESCSGPQDAGTTPPAGTAENRATIRYFARILMALFICEAAVMVLVYFLAIPSDKAIIIDPILLILLGTPALYWILIRPFRSSLRQQNLAFAALRQEKEDVQLYLAAAGVILIVLDRKGTVTRINRIGIDTLGYSEDEILCRNWFNDFTPSDDRETVRSYFEQLVAESPLGLQSFESRILRKDGQERVIAWHIRVLRDGTGTATGTLSSGQDVTERKKMEDDLARYREHLEELVKARTVELTRANKELSDGIAQRQVLEKELLHIIERERQRVGQELHDSIGQQLTGIAFMIETLGEMLSRTSSPEELSYVERIGARVDEAIEQVHTLARGLHPAGLDRHDLAAALRELATGTEQIFGVPCTFESESTVPIGDTSAAINLYRIAQEAITNAIKHGDAGNIEVRLTRDDGYVTLTVQNDGTDFSDHNPQNGGMGLRIMRYRAEMIDGSFRIEKSTTGGTVVTCIVPETALA